MGLNLSFALGDVWDWRPEQPLDVLVCNAVLQWVPGHDELLLRWADLLAPGGWLAFQLPGNFDQPSHAIVREMAGSPRWRGLLADAGLNRQAGDPADYVALLARPGFEVDAWETSYLHILHGENPVLEWTKGTTLRPVLAALDAEQADAFVREYGERLQRGVSPAVVRDPLSLPPGVHGRAPRGPRPGLTGFSPDPREGVALAPATRDIVEIYSLLSNRD